MSAEARDWVEALREQHTQATVEILDLKSILALNLEQVLSVLPCPVPLPIPVPLSFLPILAPFRVLPRAPFTVALSLMLLSHFSLPSLIYLTGHR